jgi:hypothetical protein
LQQFNIDEKSTINLRKEKEMKKSILFVFIALGLLLHSVSIAGELKNLKIKTAAIDQNVSFDIKDAFKNYPVKFETISTTGSNLFPFRVELAYGKIFKKYGGFIMFNLLAEKMTYIQFGPEFWLEDIIEYKGKEIALIVNAIDTDNDDRGILYFATYNLNDEQLLSAVWGDSSRCGVRLRFIRYNKSSELYILVGYGDCKGSENVCFYKHNSNEPIYCEDGSHKKMTGPNKTLFVNNDRDIKMIDLKTGKDTIQ